MAEITRSRTGEFLRELFRILIAAPEGMRASEALQLLAGRFTLSPYEADYDESGSRRFEKNPQKALGIAAKCFFLLVGGAGFEAATPAA